MYDQAVPGSLFLESLEGDTAFKDSRHFLFSRGEGELSIATTSLEYLLEEEYASLDGIRKRFSGSYDLDGDGKKLPPTLTPPPKYQCFAREWFRHVCAIPNPPEDFMLLLHRFLCSRQFVYWSEYVTVESREFVLRAERELRKWLRGLGELSEVGRLICLDYAIKPYREISHTFKKIEQDELFHLISDMALGDYLYERGDKRAFEVRQGVSSGLGALLGSDHHLSLKAQGNDAAVRLWQGYMRQARDLLLDLSERQHRILGKDKQDMWVSLALVAQAKYYMNDFEGAHQTILRVIEGLGPIVGEEHPIYLGVLLTKAQIHVQQQQLADGTKELQAIYDTLKAKFGISDGFSVYAQGFLGDAYRKARMLDVALELQEDNYQHRRAQTSYPSDYIVVDSAIALSITLRDSGKHKDALELVEKTRGDVADLPERECQVAHIAGLLGVDGGDLDGSIRVLLNFVIQTPREKYNRGLLWLLLDLAILLRRANKSEESSCLFDDLLQHSDDLTELEGEPSSPRILKLAEEACWLIRRGTPSAAEALLKENNLAWVREEDTWFWEAGSPADTGTMNPPDIRTLTDRAYEVALCPSTRLHLRYL